MATDKKQAKKKQVALTSLEQVKPETVTIYIDIGNPEEELVIQMRSPSYAQWELLADEIPAVVPDLVGAAADKSPIYDRNSAAYYTKITTRNEEVVFNRLLWCISPFVEVPGATKEEQRAALKAMDRNATSQMISGMLEMVQGGRARLEHISRTFPPVGHTPGKD